MKVLIEIYVKVENVYKLFSIGKVCVHLNEDKYTVGPFWNVLISRIIYHHILEIINFKMKICEVIIG